MKLRSQLFISVLTLFFIAGCQPGSERSSESGTENSIGFMQHNVYFYLNDDVTPEEIEDFEEGLKDLLSISAIYKSELGVPAGTEERDVTDHSFVYVIYTWFETMDDYQTYAEHPDHLVFIDTYSDLWSDVKVYDSEIIDAQ